MTASALHTIMVPVRGDGKGDNVLAHAAVLAKRFGARVRVVHCHPKADDLMPYGVVIPAVLRRQIEEATDRLMRGRTSLVIPATRESRSSERTTG